MKRLLKWYELLSLNGYQLGLSIASNVISPLLLPALVLAFMPPEKKNTYTALVYVTGPLLVASSFPPGVAPLLVPCAHPLPAMVTSLRCMAGAGVACCGGTPPCAATGAAPMAAAVAGGGAASTARPV